MFIQLRTANYLCDRVAVQVGIRRSRNGIRPFDLVDLALLVLTRGTCRLISLLILLLLPCLLLFLVKQFRPASNDGDRDVPIEFLDGIDKDMLLLVLVGDMGGRFFWYKNPRLTFDMDAVASGRCRKDRQSFSGSHSYALEGYRDARMSCDSAMKMMHGHWWSIKLL